MSVIRKTRNTQDKALQAVITKALNQQLEHDASSPEFAQITAQLLDLYKLKESDSKKRVSADTLALIGGNLAGIVAILGYERAHVVTSKALGFVLRAAR